jgi:hypothetical protein
VRGPKQGQHATLRASTALRKSERMPQDLPIHCMVRGISDGGIMARKEAEC